MKNIFMAVLAVSSLPDIVLAQDLPHQHTELNEIVISASPLEESAAGVNQAVSVLSGEALHNAAAATIGETLQNEPGVTSSGFGPGVGKPVIRGQVGNRVKVMQDSVGTLDASSASGDHVITGMAMAPSVVSSMLLITVFPTSCLKQQQVLLSTATITPMIKIARL